ncbi:LLM class flavin-dependent oxidoreductase [Rhodococcus sp. X156]|uniref:LLM class flavin-dependent oxidoreductase n=1 Tax=Rhodococcus sp. X156 TaxID=2499145 RepID=UPI000FD9D263|nr:LLM class flavin-dependent oxidoreductase [Rhodococcus sp. X156]
MRVGVVLLPQARWHGPDGAAQQWRRVEELGFDHAWTYDHLSWQSLVDEPWFATVPTLSAAALVTSRIRLGTWVASPNYRHPVPFAKELMSLDDLSQGRFTLGLGAGGTGFDAQVLGQEVLTPGERVARLAEFTGLLDQLLTQPTTTAAGERYAAVDARMLPGCVQQPRLPFVIAANGPRAMGVAVTHGQGWATTGCTDPADGQQAWWRGVAGLVRRLDDLAEGRVLERYLNLDSAPVYSLSSVAAFTDAVGRAGELGFTDVVVHHPRAEGIYSGDVAVLEAAAELASSGALGA